MVGKEKVHLTEEELKTRQLRRQEILDDINRRETAKQSNESATGEIMNNISAVKDKINVQFQYPEELTKIGHASFNRDHGNKKYPSEEELVNDILENPRFLYFDKHTANVITDYLVANGYSVQIGEVSMRAAYSITILTKNENPLEARLNVWLNGKGHLIVPLNEEEIVKHDPPFVLIALTPQTWREQYS